MSNEPLIIARDIVKTYRSRRKLFSREQVAVRAVDGVSLFVNPGETLGLVGESGCGKSTLGNCMLRIVSPDSGAVRFLDGERGYLDVLAADERDRKALCRKMQMVFQDPYSSIDPRMTVRDVVGEPLVIQGMRGSRRAYEDRVAELLSIVGLEGDSMERYPHAFSGGQRQRICIARALATDPKFVVCDEAVSALDVSVRAQVLNLFIDLRRRLDLSYLFISHDLSVIRYISHRVAVMYLGRIVEEGGVDDVFERPAHPYTNLLLNAIPIPNPEKRRRRSLGEIADLAEAGTAQGCSFRPRCPRATAECDAAAPALCEASPTHRYACFNPNGVW